MSTLVSSQYLLIMLGRRKDVKNGIGYIAKY